MMLHRIARVRRSLLSALALGLICTPILTTACLGQEAGAPPVSPAHYVVLIDLGGFRWDYITHDGAKNLQSIGKSGVIATDGMLPSYPSSTWPNVWTLVTGLYPGHHGIVANRFFEPATK